ncbi:MAG: energy transducer TonB [Mariprofundaceae bacterium]
MASAAIHGLLLVSWQTVGPGDEASLAADGGPSVRVELLEDDKRKEPAAAAVIATAQNQAEFRMPAQAPEKSGRGISRTKPQKPVERKNPRVDQPVQAMQAQPKSRASMAKANALSASQASHLIRQHLESFKYYPASARRRGIEGSVEVRFALATGGRAAELEVITGSGYVILDRAALQTVHRAEPFPLASGSYRFRLVFRRS